MECEHDWKLTPSRKKKGRFYYRCSKCNGEKQACAHEFEIVEKENWTINQCLKCGASTQFKGAKVKHKTININKDSDLILEKSSPDRKEHSKYKFGKHCLLRMRQRRITVKDIEKTILNGKFVLIAGVVFVNYVFNNMVVRVDPDSKSIVTCYRKLGAA